MKDRVTGIRLQLLHIIGAVGSIREGISALEPTDTRYFDDETAKIQSAAHRLLEVLEAIENRH